MSSVVDTRTSLKPIYEAKPDMRFATTFLSNKYRDYAVNGESIMDKATGEIFTKRKEDGRVVSFFQNKKYLNDLMLNLRILLNNNVSFTYPDESDLEAFFVSTDYDVMSINDEKDIDIMESDITIPNTEDTPLHQVKFKISKKSNGFFIRLTSRDNDKAVIEWMTNQYDAMFKGYDGDVIEYREQAAKFENIEKWKDTNATLFFTLRLVTGTNVATYTLRDYIRVNEESCVKFPVSIGSDTLQSCDYVEVQIDSIQFEKMRFMLDRKAALPIEFIDGLNKFMYMDKSMYIRYISINSFVDKSTDIELLGNEFIIAMIDMPYCYRYMTKMAGLITDSSFLLSPTRPDSSIWKPNTIWAEQIRDVFKGGYKIDAECEVDLKQLENFLAENDDTDYVLIRTDEADAQNMYARITERS